MADLDLYKVDLDTPQPGGRRGESPRAAFTKYNDALTAIQTDISAVENGKLPSSAVGTSVTPFGQGLFNLLPNAGRFCPPTEVWDNRITGWSATGSEMSPYNGSSFHSAGKYQWDSTSNGGTQPAIPNNILQLLSAMGTPNIRYRPEFYVTTVRAGSGTATVSIGADSVARYPAYTLGGLPLVGYDNTASFAAWVRVNSGSAHVGGRVYYNGDRVPEGTPITAAMGWTHVVRSSEVTAGYNSTFGSIYTTPGAEVFIALPALIPGLIGGKVHIHAVPTIRSA